jgi:hypothetical protein
MKRCLGRLIQQLCAGHTGGRWVRKQLLQVTGVEGHFDFVGSKFKSKIILCLCPEYPCFCFCCELSNDMIAFIKKCSFFVQN